MIGITIPSETYAAIAHTRPAGFGQEIVAGQEHVVWLPQAVVNHLRRLREPHESFSDVILRLAERGCYAAITR
jgi:hypothetical protein